MPTPRREREIYAQLVASTRHLDPSNIVHELDKVRSRSWPVEELARRWAEAAAAAGPAAAWNMYLHVPFCKSICTFCNYKRLRVSSTEALDNYVDFILRESAAFTAALQGVAFGALYVGGGTPSVLSAKQLDRLLGGLHDAFSFHERAQKNFEYDPMVMTPERFAVVESFGFTRYSFGIQSVDVDVNTLHNRGPQGRGHVAKQFELLERHGAESVNVDYLFGLDGTTPEGILSEVEDCLGEHRPTEVTIYFVTPTPAYVAERFGGSFSRFAEHMQPFERAAVQIPAMAERHDYSIATTGRHVVVLHDNKPKKRKHRSLYDYCDIASQIHRPLFLLGLGDSARSRIFGRMRYRAVHDDDDLLRLSPRYVGTEITVRDEMFHYLALTFRDGDRLRRDDFRRTFGVDVVDAYANTLAKLHELGALRVTDEHIELTSASRRDRLRDTLFFLPRERRRDLAAVTG